MPSAPAGHRHTVGPALLPCKACCIRLLTCEQLWPLHHPSIICLQGSVQMLPAAAAIPAPSRISKAKQVYAVSAMLMKRDQGYQQGMPCSRYTPVIARSSSSILSREVAGVHHAPQSADPWRQTAASCHSGSSAPAGQMLLLIPESCLFQGACKKVLASRRCRVGPET